MPVFMVKADKKSLEEQPSWRIDLQKIYTEGSSEIAQEFITEKLAEPNTWFAGALFNDHLLGAVLVTERPDCWLLSHLWVRKVTQRRGVAKRLLELLAIKAKEQGKYLVVASFDANPAAEALLAKLDCIKQQKNDVQEKP